MLACMLVLSVTSSITIQDRVEVLSQTRCSDWSLLCYIMY
jgi:hypothetical protein